jgi:hypothetical protein
MAWHPLAGGIIGWKFDNEPGMTTYDGEITEWPVDKLGPWPSQEMLDLWATEYHVHLLTLPEDER